MAISRDTIVEAESRLRDASIRLGDVDEDIRNPEESKFQLISSPSTELQKCQRSIELSAKSILDLSGVSYPKTHGFDLDSDHIIQCIDAINGEIDDEASEKAGRAFVLASIWSGAYPGTEYGIASLSPDALYRRGDAEMAYEHATEVREYAEKIIERAKDDVDD